MSEEQEKRSSSHKNLLQGSVLILISNLVYIGNNYLVAWTQLAAPEIALARGGLQIVVFGVIVWRERKMKREEDVDSGPKSSGLPLYALVVLYGFTVSSMSFACLAAIPLMPIGDLIVISFTSPVFSVFFDRIVLKRTLTVLSICLCLFIVIGDVLVVQPPFIFGEDNDLNNTTNSSMMMETESEKQGNMYYLGVGLCVYAAASGALANVVGARCNKMDISTSQLMLASGFSSLLLSLVSTSFLPNRLVTDPLSLTLPAALLLPVSAIITMLAYWTITLAVSITRNPTLISMLRSTEILISLVTESIWWGKPPGTISLLGSLLVAACVLSMAAHGSITTFTSQAWEKCRGRQKEDSVQTVQIVTAL